MKLICNTAIKCMQSCKSDFGLLNASVGLTIRRIIANRIFNMVIVLIVFDKYILDKELALNHV